MLLNRTSLSLAKLVGSKERSAYTSQAIQVEPDVCVVTDGTHLVCVAHQKMDDKNFPVTPGLESADIPEKGVLVHASAALHAVKALPRRPLYPISGFAALGKDGKLYVNQRDDVAASVQSFGEGPAIGTFPDWRRVFRADPVAGKSKPTMQVVFNAARLETLAAFVREHGGQDSTVRLSIYDSTQGVKFEAESATGQTIIMLLMPCRDDIPAAVLEFFNVLMRKPAPSERSQ